MRRTQLYLAIRAALPWHASDHAAICGAAAVQWYLDTWPGLRQ